MSYSTVKEKRELEGVEKRIYLKKIAKQILAKEKPLHIFSHGNAFYDGVNE